MLETDICILGGGIMGCSTAYWISQLSKAHVTILDRYGVGNEYSSSNDVNRVFRFAYGHDEMYTRMAMVSLEHWLALEQESHEELLTRTGLLMINGDDESANRFNQTSYETLTRLGLGAEEINGPNLKLRFPQFTARDAYFDPHGGVLYAAKALFTFQRLARTRNVQFATEKVTKIVGGDRLEVILESNKRIRCRKLILTMGPWSNNILKPGLPRMFPTRQQLIYFKPKSRIDNFRPFSFPVFFTDQYYGLPAAGIDAVKVSPKELREKIDPDNTNQFVDPDQIELCRDVCRKYIPGLANGEVLHSRVCFYDMTENTDFVIDRDSENSNIVYGYGFSGHGFKFAPLIGKLLAELVLDREPSFNIDRFTARSDNRRFESRGQLGQGE